MKFKLFVRNNGVALATHSPITRALGELGKYGYQFTDRDYDIAIMNFCNFPKGPMFHAFLKRINDDSSPIIILDERVSAGRLPYWHLSQERVIGFVKTSLLKDKSLYQFKYPKASYHYHLMDKVYNRGESFGYRTNVNNGVFHKVHLGWNLGLYDFFVNTRPDFEAYRPIDLHFSIITEPFFEQPNPDKHYALHRNHFVEEVDKVVSKHDFIVSGQCGRRRMFPVVKDEIDEGYHSSMSNSKVCLSPFGDGEMCWRDFEAIVHGAILIKPDVSFLETWPDIYRPMETYIPIELSLSNFEEVICEVINNYSKYKYITINAHKALKQSFSNKNFARRFDQLIRKVLEKENRECRR